jgi:hypothetical protein
MFSSLHWAVSSVDSVYNGWRDPAHGTYDGPADTGQPSVMVDAGQRTFRGGADGRRRLG